MTTIEANFDGLVGPTHHYGGLSWGNVASTANRASVANPRDAALQGLDKMAALVELGLPQGVLPPQARPDTALLRQLGFSGDDATVIDRAAQQAPGLLSAASSAAAMWTANAATVSPGADTQDGRVHFTPANLTSKLHRASEHPTTARAMQAVFSDPAHYAHHPALPGTPALGDEGAANHTRLAAAHGEPGVECFVYGADDADGPGRFPARQTRLASEAIARLHGLAPARTVFARQHPAAIDAGVFHNDVIGVGNLNTLLLHEQALADQDGALAALRRACDFELHIVQIGADQVPLDDAVQSYLFNSQLLSLGDGTMLLVCAQQCRDTPSVWTAIQSVLAADNPIRDVRVFDLNQSMRNGGGPACLRLRVVLDPAQRAAVNPACWITADRLDTLRDWVRRHYRDRLAVEDLADPNLQGEVHTALDALTQILSLGSIYPFQRTDA